jgi:Family of unknown function (DUF6518)
VSSTIWPVRALGTWQSVVRAIAIVVVVTIIVGGLTSPAQQYLPDALRSLANAAGPWFVTVLAALYAGRGRLVVAVILGIAGFLLLNISYGVVSELRGFSYSAGPHNIWSILAFPVGVIAGLAASWLRSSRSILVAIGASAPAAVLLGEGVYGLTMVLDTTGPVVWILELVCGVALLVAVSLRRLRSFRSIALCVGLAVLGAIALYAGLLLV